MQVGKKQKEESQEDEKEIRYSRLGSRLRERPPRRREKRRRMATNREKKRINPFPFPLSSYSFFQSSLFAAREEISARGWNSECNFRAKTAPACIFPDRDSLSDYQSTGNYRLLGCFIEDGKWVHLVVINYSPAV